MSDWANGWVIVWVSGWGHVKLLKIQLIAT